MFFFDLAGMIELKTTPTWSKKDCALIQNPL